MLATIFLSHIYPYCTPPNDGRGDRTSVSSHAPHPGCRLTRSAKVALCSSSTKQARTRTGVPHAASPPTGLTRRLCCPQFGQVTSVAPFSRAGTPVPQSSFPFPHAGSPQREGHRVPLHQSSFTPERSDPEVKETMTHDAKHLRNDAHGEAHRVLFYALIMAGAEGCGPAP
jgi:hypothetical protein